MLFNNVASIFGTLNENHSCFRDFASRYQKAIYINAFSTSPFPDLKTCNEHTCFLTVSLPVLKHAKKTNVSSVFSLPANVQRWWFTHHVCFEKREEVEKKQGFVFQFGLRVHYYENGLASLTFKTVL